MQNTKEKILETALTLFNTRGLKNTTLQIIADKVKISVGNLAYHYKNKQEIIGVHSLELEAQLKEALTHYRNYPNFLDFHIQLEKILEVLSHYAYIFSNLGEMKLAYPDTFEILQTFYQKLSDQIESRISYQADKEHLQIAEEKEVSFLAKSISHAILFSQNRSLLESDNTKIEIIQEVWNLLKPYFSKSGEDEWTFLISPTIS